MHVPIRLVIVEDVLREDLVSVAGPEEEALFTWLHLRENSMGYIPSTIF